VEEAAQLLERGNAGTLAGWPMIIAGVNKDINILGAERETLQLYSEFIFCPILRGDTPA
jgi:hypothetical protein